MFPNVVCQARAITKQFGPCEDRSLKGAIMASDEQAQLPVVSCVGPDTQAGRTHWHIDFSCVEIVVEMLHQNNPR